MRQKRTFDLYQVIDPAMPARRFPPPWSIDELEAWHARQATAGRRVQRFP